MTGSSDGPSIQKNHQRQQVLMKHFSFYQNIFCWKDRFSQAHWCCNNHYSAGKIAEDTWAPRMRWSITTSKQHWATRREPITSHYLSTFSTPIAVPVLMPQKYLALHFQNFPSSHKNQRRTTCTKTQTQGPCNQKISHCYQASKFDNPWKPFTRYIIWW